MSLAVVGLFGSTPPGHFARRVNSKGKRKQPSNLRLYWKDQAMGWDWVGLGWVWSACREETL